jgi:hypothetical protein
MCPKAPAISYECHRYQSPKYFNSEESGWRSYAEESSRCCAVAFERDDSHLKISRRSVFFLDKAQSRKAYTTRQWGD